jgi:hypothetical protein
MTLVQLADAALVATPAIAFRGKVSANRREPTLDNPILPVEGTFSHK